MDIGGLGVDVNYRFENIHLFEEKDEGGLLSLIDKIDRGPGGGRPQPHIDSVFSDSIDDELLTMSTLDRNLLMTLQMSPESSVGASRMTRSGAFPTEEILLEDREVAQRTFCPSDYSGWSSIFESRLVPCEYLGTGRERKFSTSSYTGPCIAPDLAINNLLNSSADEFPLPDIEDVQDQILLENGHQTLQPDDLLIPLDDPSDAKALQEQLISQITGSEPFIDKNNLSSFSTNEMLFNQDSSNVKVKKVESAHGSQNVCIDGIDVQLPAGSIVLAVVDETGSLVPVPATTRTYDDLTTTTTETTGADAVIQKLLGSSDLSLPSAVHHVPGSQCVQLGALLERRPSCDHQMVKIEQITQEETEEGCLSPRPIHEFMEMVSVKKEKEDPLFNDVEIGEEFIDIETMSETTPVIEAVDLDSLLAEFEATENVNINIEMKQETNRSRTRPLQTVPENKPPNAAVEKVEGKHNPVLKAVKPQNLSDYFRTSRSTPKFSIKVKKEETNKASKSLIERKNQIMLKKMTAHQRIKDLLPYEIIEKIKASGKRSSTKILAEALLPRRKGKNRPQTTTTKKRISKKGAGKEKINHNQEDKENKNITSTPFPTDHDYCWGPQKKSQSKQESESKFYNKIPDYYTSQPPPDSAKSPVEDFGKKDSGVESGDFSDSSIEVEENKSMSLEPTQKGPMAEESDQKPDKIDHNSSPPENLYNRLPDYVTDIGNSKQKEMGSKDEDNTTSVGTQDSASSSDNTKPDQVENEPKKKKLKLSEYRMRVRSSADNSRSNSPLVGVDKKKVKSENEEKRQQSQGDRMESEGLTVNENNHNVPVTTSEEREEGELKEEVEKEARNIPQATNKVVVDETPPPNPDSKKVRHRRLPQDVKQVAKSSKPVPKPSKPVPKPSKPVPKPKERREAKATRKNIPNIIEIDLSQEDNDEPAKNTKPLPKLGLIHSLPLSKMPTTSLGHSLLFSRVNASSQDKKTNRSGNKTSRSYNSSSRSRSRSRSKKRSHSHKSIGSHTSSHRKSRRRWSRASRDRSKSNSRSYTPTCSSCSYDSFRSSSREFSKSFYSRSRSRSRSSKRRESRSKRSKRHTRSRERRHRRSRSRSPREGHGGRRNARSPQWGYPSRSAYTKHARYIQPHMATRYMSRHRSIEEIERDVQERRVIYVGAIEEGTTRADLRRRFEKFGQVVDINIHFRERGDNYGFVTYRYRENAYNALEHGNDDATLPKYNLCFGGRRSFCKVQYSDLDAQSEDYGFPTTPSAMDYDSLLQAALQMRR